MPLLNFAKITGIQAGDDGKGLLGQTALLPMLADRGAKEPQCGFVVGWQWMSCLAARHPSTPWVVRATEDQQEDGDLNTPRLLSGGSRRDQ